MDRRLILPVAIMFASVLLLSGLMTFQAGSAQESPAPDNSGPILEDSATITQKADSKPATATSSEPSENKAPAPTPTMVYVASKGHSTVSYSTFPNESPQKISSDAVNNESSPVKADFYVEINCLTANFTDMSENATSWEWDFGDDTSSTLQGPGHTYAENGTYIVNLTVYNDDGYSDSVEDFLYVEGCPASESPEVDDEEPETEYPEQEVPEFPTVAIPMLAIIGMAFFFGRKQ